MGSELRLTATATDEAVARPAFDAVFAEFERLEALMSTWRPASDVVRINAAAGIEPVPVHADVREVLRQAKQISEWTEGTFDVTFGALTDVWKFDHDQDNTVPSRRGDPRAAAADRLSPDRDRRSCGHGLPETQRDEDPSRRHRQGLRRRARAPDPAQGRSAGFHDPGRRRSLRRRPQERRAVAFGDSGSARTRGPDLRDDRSQRQHLQHLRRLRALLLQGRRPLSPHPRPAHGSAGARYAAA